MKDGVKLMADAIRKEEAEKLKNTVRDNTDTEDVMAQFNKRKANEAEEAEEAEDNEDAEDQQDDE